MRAENLTLSFGTNVIYDNAEFNIPSRAKCGIVGVNGAGKTTLFKIILGQIMPDYGNIYTDGATIGYLPQVIEIKNPDVTVWNFIASARPVKQIESQLHDLYVALADNPDDIAVQNDINIAQEKLEILDAYNAENVMLDIIALILVIIGGINWGSIGIFQFDLVAWLFGGQAAIVSRIIYTLVGIAALWCISLLFRENSIVRSEE